jgi:ankyrin repeat protein
LHSAAYEGHNDVVELLLAKGANVNAKINDGFTPLYEAASNGQKDVTELLLAKGADVNAKDNDGKTPLQVAKPEVADLLHVHGARN